MNLRIFPDLFGTSNFQFSKKAPHLSAGFTLVELLVVSSIIIVFITSVLVIISDLFRTRAVGDRKEVMQNTMTLLANELTQEIVWSVSASHTDMGVNDELTLIREESSGGTITTTYRVDSGILLKNNESLTPSDVKITSFDIHNLGTADIPLWRVTVELEMTTGTIPPLNNVITVSMRKKFVQ